MFARLLLLALLAAASWAQTPVILNQCDFESDLCGWQNIKGTDVFDWSRQSGGTSTANTGPVTDHTKGTAAGSYLYIETSVTPKGSHAELISPVLTLTSAQNCFSLYYSMYGAHVGALNIYIKPVGKDMQKPAILTRNLNVGKPDWLQANVNVPKTNGQIQFVIEGVRGNGFQGDIAIDDIKISNSRCVSDSGTVTGTAAPGNTTPAPIFTQCNFDSGNICGWSQDRTDQFDWTFSSKNTGTTGTGPPYDHTSGSPSSGKYIFIETSAPRNSGDKARLVTSMFPAGKRCLQFFYHMIGRNVGTLKVYTQDSGSKTLRSQFEVTGQVGDNWNVGYISIDSKVPYQVMFEGVRGDGIFGDIALDDIQLLPATQSVCPSTDLCSFETGWCAFQNTPLKDQFDWTLRGGRTPSSSTGPVADHTLQTAVGKYIYIEASGRRLGDSARLLSYVYNPSPLYVCLSFHYHMLGVKIGTLSVRISTATSETALWEKTGQVGNAWNFARFQIPPQKTPYQVVFVGITSDGMQGDIALDDIRTTMSGCSTIPIDAGPTTTSTTSTTPKPTTTPIATTKQPTITMLGESTSV